MRRIFSKIYFGNIILATLVNFDLTMGHFQYLEHNIELLVIWRCKEILPKIWFFGNIMRFYPKWDKILEILTFNSARILRLTYAPRSAAFIHLRFIARIFQPQESLWEKKEENGSLLYFVPSLYLFCVP